MVLVAAEQIFLAKPSIATTLGAVRGLRTSGGLCEGACTLHGAQTTVRGKARPDVTAPETTTATASTTNILKKQGGSTHFVDCAADFRFFKPWVGSWLMHRRRLLLLLLFPRHTTPNLARRTWRSPADMRELFATSAGARATWYRSEQS